MNRKNGEWTDVVAAARKGFGAGVDAWSKETQVIGGTVRGADAFITPGSLRSHRSFERELRATLTAGGASDGVSRAIATELWGAWKAWGDGFQCTLSGSFPELASYPGAHAPPTQGQGVTPLQKSSSAGESRLSGNILATKLARAPLRPGEDRRTASSAMEELASWVEKRFKEWKAQALLDASRLYATGPVPSYHPPQAPVGPVVDGELVPGGGTGVFRAPPFGN